MLSSQTRATARQRRRRSIKKLPLATEENIVDEEREREKKFKELAKMFSSALRGDNIKAINAPDILDEIISKSKTSREVLKAIEEVKNESRS